MKDIERYFKKHKIEVEHIISAYCKSQNLVICMDSGDEYSCSMLLHELTERLPMMLQFVEALLFELVQFYQLVMMEYIQ